MSSATRQQLENWLKTIDVKANFVMDVGGSQFPIKGRTKSWNVENYRILDLQTPHECKQEPDIYLDLNEEPDEGWKALLTDIADVVFCIEVAEYIWNPVQAFQNINRFLKSGGLLYLSSHFIYPCHSPIEDDCLRYTRRGITKILEKCGFKIIDIQERFVIGDTMSFYLSQGMRPDRNYKHHNEVGNLITAQKI